MCLSLYWVKQQDTVRKRREKKKRKGKQARYSALYLQPQRLRRLRGENCWRPAWAPHEILISKEKRKKMVKQHLFFTKKKQTRCQETPAFSPLPFCRRNHVSTWVSCLLISTLPSSFPSCTALAMTLTAPDMTVMHSKRKPHKTNWTERHSMFQEQEKFSMETVQGHSPCSSLVSDCFVFFFLL